MPVKISIITVVYNGEAFIRDCIESILAQTYPNLEYIFIDGNSTDQTFAIAQTYKDRIQVLISAPDKGMYDALNKGIDIATGEVIGILNADDLLAAPTVIEKIAKAFLKNEIDAVYGNLNYIHPQQTNKVIRKWRSNAVEPKDLAFGWMPAHPTLYLKKSVFEQYGNYSLSFGSAADYELMLRMLYKHQLKTYFLDELIVKMRTGGMSNQSTKHRYTALLNDYKALKCNEIPFPILALILKKLRKIKQFF